MLGLFLMEQEHSMDFPPQHFEQVIFQQPKPLKLRSDGGLRLSGANQTKTGMLMRPPSLPCELFFFVLLRHTPGVFQKLLVAL